MANERNPFKVICTNCGAEAEFKDNKNRAFTNDDQPISIIGSPFYDSATVEIECDKCKNEIEL